MCYKITQITSYHGFGNSKTIFSPSDPDDFCNRLIILLQEKEAGNNSEIISE